METLPVLLFIALTMSTLCLGQNQGRSGRLSCPIPSFDNYIKYRMQNLFCCPLPWAQLAPGCCPSQWACLPYLSARPSQNSILDYLNAHNARPGQNSLLDYLNAHNARPGKNSLQDYLNARIARPGQNSLQDYLNAHNVRPGQNSPHDYLNAHNARPGQNSPHGNAHNARPDQNSPQDYLNAHNDARARVGVGPMTWDEKVAGYARKYVNSRLRDCNLVHSSNSPYGENLAKGDGDFMTGAKAVKLWEGEKSDYNYRSNKCAVGKVCGHYTQVVWPDSVRLGCARARCNNRWWYISCNYAPPGNYVGQRPY